MEDNIFSDYYDEYYRSKISGSDYYDYDLSRTFKKYKTDRSNPFININPYSSEKEIKAVLREDNLKIAQEIDKIVKSIDPCGSRFKSSFIITDKIFCYLREDYHKITDEVTGHDLYFEFKSEKEDIWLIRMYQTAMEDSRDNYLLHSRDNGVIKFLEKSILTWIINQ